MIFDSHAHYDDEAFDKDRDCLLSTMEEQGVGCIVNVGASFQGAKDSVELSMRYPHVYAAVGVHPDHVGELDEVKMQHLREMCTMEKTVAVGEIGLDYYWDKESHELQKEWFKKQMELAKEVDLPVIVHSREAAQDTFDLIKSEHAGTTGGVIHCFSGSKEMAKEYIKMGYYIGALRLFRLLFKLIDRPVRAGVHDTEAGRLCHRHIAHGDGAVGLVLLVEAEHPRVVHLVDMVAGENQKIFW